MGAYDLNRRVEGMGQLPCALMFIGEGPGETEHKLQKPFAGLSGEEMSMYLAKARLSRRYAYVTNVVKYWTGPGNPDPTPEDIARDHDDLMYEIARCKPKVIACIGRIALNVFFPDLTMEEAHGIPRYCAEFDVIVVPCFHPAYGLHTASMAKYVYDDFQVLGKVVRQEITWDEREDQFPKPQYVLGEGHMIFPSMMRLPEPANLDGPSSALSQVKYGPARPFALSKGMLIAIDTEGSVKHPYCLTYSVAPGWACMIKAGDKKAIADFNKFLRSTVNPRVIFHFAQHDIPVLAEMGVELPEQVDDTMVMAYECFEPQALKVLCRRHHGMSMQDYEDITRLYDNRQAIRFLLLVKNKARSLPKPDAILEYKDGEPKVRHPIHITTRIASAITNERPRRAWFKIEDEIRAPLEQQGWKMPDFSLQLVPFDKVLHYACRDADGTLRMAHTFLPWIASDKHLTTLYEMDRAIIPATVQMEQVGMPINHEKFRILGRDMDLGMAEIIQSLKKLNDGQYLNPGSPPQVRAFLFDKIGLRSKMLTKKTRKPSTNDKALEALKNAHPGVSLITAYRGKAKIKDAFVEVLPYLAAHDGRIHPSIKLTRAVTGRRTITDPPLQGIPVREAEGRRIRDAFEVEDSQEQFMAAVDLAQIEMRVMADQSKDTKLIRLMVEGKDIHSITAAQMFGVTVEQAKADNHRYRDPAKRVGFGVITGITDKGLFDQFEMNGIFEYTQADCAQMIIDWFRIYEGVWAYIEACREEAKRRGFVRTMFGRARGLPGIWSNIPWVRGEAERNSHSHKIQGSAAEIQKRGEARVWAALKRPDFRHARLLLTIHDELLLEGASGGGREEALGKMLVSCLTQDQELMRVPLEASYAYGSSWGGLK